MRSDALGFFWEDRPVVKISKAKPKRNPPDPVWERAGYLPNLEEALRFDVQQFTDIELASSVGRKLLYDLEVYPNYFLAAFACVATGRIVFFERINDQPFDTRKMKWVLDNFCIVGFNSINFDLPICAVAVADKPNAIMQEATELIINGRERPSEVLKKYRVKAIKANHIDLIEVAPLSASLKIYSGRIHAKRMQDLPFKPGTVLTMEQIAIVRWYCINDLANTGALNECLKEELKLRESMSQVYGTDLRSKSDAQVAESVIAKEITKLNGERPQRPVIPVGTRYRYRVPAFIRFETPLMNWALSRVTSANFIVSENGAVGMPHELNDLQLTIANSTYTLGIGGLHSTEQSVSHIEDDDCFLEDRDVVSFYPYIILLLGLYPYHLGPNFLQIYRGIVNRRVEAKKAGNKVEADSLKITVNGSYGKFGSKYSILYSPDLIIQVTLTGQLSLLMLIERLELQGIPVVSANTDGVVIKCPRQQKELMASIVQQWERDTGFETEGVNYVALYSKDVNNYIAVKKDGKTKTKGAYANPWSDPKSSGARLHKNPTNTICVEAVEALITKNIPIEATIRECNDIRKFVSVRHVKGGAVKDGTYLGKSIRWYYAAGEGGEIVYAINGNKVPKSDGAKPLMDLPDTMPSDVDYDWYINEAQSILVDIAYRPNLLQKAYS